MTQAINCTRKKSIALELISDKQLTDIRKSSELLFTGKIAVKNEGGFKKHYDLPTPSLLDRLKHGSMSDVLSVRVKHNGWLCNRDSGWSKNMCILFANHGLLFIYNKPTKGYVVKLSYALKLEIFCGRKKIKLEDTMADSCSAKLKFDFGSIEIQLTKGQIEKWRQPLLNAFDGKLPCFETTQVHEEEVAKSLADSDKNEAMDSTRNVDDMTFSNTTSLSALPVSSLLTASSDGSEPSLSSLKLSSTNLECDDNYMAIKRFLAPFKDPNGGNLAFSEVCKEVKTDVNDEDRDSGIGFIEEVGEKIENISECRPVPPVRASKLSTHLSTDLSPRFRQTDTAFDLPVYRLETEREKLRPREPQKRIAEKIRYFEEILGKESISKDRDSHKKWSSTII